MGNLSLFPDALIAAILGYGVVFAGLIMLMAVVVIAGKAMSAKKASVASPAAAGAAPQAAAAAPAKDGPVAPGSAGKIALYNTSDRDAAMIMAIVADQLGKPINELRFKSIKEVK